MPNAHIQAFTAVEIEYLSRKSGLPIEQTIKELQKAGLGLNSRGGAEIFSARVRDNVCPGKICGRRVVKHNANCSFVRLKEQRHNAYWNWRNHRRKSGNIC
ncbi:MAG: hypothetical protein M0C28_39795 [Candidatus Moduliflexus flocculans]|nr:hypothetical protein [Candidatus Moduliflexus flocculans]